MKVEMTITLNVCTDGSVDSAECSAFGQSLLFQVDAEDGGLGELDLGKILLALTLMAQTKERLVRP